MRVYPQARCPFGHVHHSAQELARCLWPASDIRGGGSFAVVTRCARGRPVWLLGTDFEARERWKDLRPESGGCSRACKVVPGRLWELHLIRRLVWDERTIAARVA